jgi:hypothetical protein
LEAAPADQLFSPWCSNTSTSLGVTATGIGSGMSNTTIADRTCTSGAIQVAADYTNNSKTDWHLPSKDELQQLYNQKTKVGGFSPSGYWSSTETVDGNASGQNFDSGGHGNRMKDNPDNVRAVRAFG